MTGVNPYVSSKSYADSNIPFGVVGIAEVVNTQQVAPRLRRITLASERFCEIGELTPQTCTARLFFPEPGENDPILPSFEENPEAVYRQVTTYIGRVGQVIRTWTMRRLDLATNEADFDFVLREGRGLGLDWGKRAKRGDRVGTMLTRSGAAQPGAEFERQLMLADETALSHIAVCLKGLSAGVRVTVIGEVVDAADEQDFDSDAEVETVWVHRGDAPAGTTQGLQQALREHGKPRGAFHVQGYAEARVISGIRRFLREEWGLDRNNYRVAGFWRRGMALPDGARRGYKRIDAMAAQGITVDSEEFSKFLEYE